MVLDSGLDLDSSAVFDLILDSGFLDSGLAMALA